MARSRTLIALAAIYVVTMAGVVSAAITGWASADKVSGPVMVAYGIFSVVYAVRAARHPGLDARTRRASRVLTAALTLALATPVLFLITGPKVFPAPGDGAHMAFVVVLFAAVLMLPLRRASRRERFKTVLDAGTVVLGASMMLWYLVIGPVLTDNDSSVRIVLAASAYPVVDLLALFGFARALMRGTQAAVRGPLGMVGGGVFFLFVGDAYLGYTQAHEASVARTPWQFACWLSMHFLLACGAYEQWRQASRPAAAEGLQRRGAASKLPYAGVGVGYLLMAVAALHEAHAFPWAGLVVGGMGITGQVVLRQMIAQRESAEAAETDSLTGLANRGRLHHELSRGPQDKAVLLIDLNGFKQINDTLGHQAGDALLVAVADAMRGSVRPGDLVARLGGDEFAVVVRSVHDEAGGTAVAARIVEAMKGPFVIGDMPMSASASIGLAVSDEGARTADALLRRADVAMYDQKRRGGGWQAWHPGLEAPDEDLARAVDDRRLELAYRPITDPGGVPRGVDATLSWAHPTRGRIAADEFLPAAERLGLAERIETWVLRAAAAEAARTGGWVGLRVTAAQLRRPGFVASLAAVGHELVLHVPASALAEDPAVVAHLHQVRSSGVRVAVRDFGTAYANLRDLSTQPVDLLALDDRPDDPAVAAALIALSQALGLATLVGGVEVPAAARSGTLATHE